MQIFDDTERVKAIGIWSTVNSLGFAAGPLIGGAMLDHFWWGSIFLVNIPVAVIGLIAVVRLVPESKNPQGDRPDLVGRPALHHRHGRRRLRDHLRPGARLDAPGPVLLTAVAGIVVLAGFVLWELHVPYPMLDMHFFRNQRFIGAVAGAHPRRLRDDGARSSC